jgi:hypothetical protein
MTLDKMLDSVTVHVVCEDMNRANGGKLTGLLGMYYVVDDNQVRGYFHNERDAMFFRLAIINATLNQVAMED